MRENLAQSTNFSLRRTFIGYCKQLITLIPYDMFKKICLDDLLGLKSDKNEKVKIDLCDVAVSIKPYLD